MRSGWTVYVAACAAGVIGGALAAMATSGPSTVALVAVVAAVALLAAIASVELRDRRQPVATGDDGASAAGLPMATEQCDLPSESLVSDAGPAAPVVASDAVATPAGHVAEPVARDEIVPAVVDSPAGPTTTDSRALDENDWNGLATICSGITDGQVAWMRAETFSRPWFDERVRPFVDLEPAVAALRGRPFSVELRTRLDVFADVLSAFAAFYSDNTFPDPLLPASDWRFFDWNELTDSAPGAPTGDLWSARAARMQGFAVALANAYEVARDTAMGKHEVASP